MAGKLHAFALWVGIAGSVAAVYSVHVEISGNRKAEGQRADDQVKQRQKDVDALYRRIGDDEADIRLIKAQMPKNQQVILDAIWQARKEARDMDMAVKAKATPTSTGPHLDWYTAHPISSADEPAMERPTTTAKPPLPQK